MNTISVMFLRLVCLALAGGILFDGGYAGAASGDISTTNKYAWSESSGWINFKSTHGAVTVHSNHLTGYAWGEGIGWIKLGVSGGGPYVNSSASNWGVNKDGSGNLSGYAWSENAGWINFHPSHSQVTISPTTGDFAGYAWNEAVGFIHLQNASPAYKVQEQPPPTVTTGEASAISTSGATLNGAVNANNAEASVSFEYGLTTGYGSTVTATPNSVTGLSNTSVNAELTSLAAGTTYHFRVVSTNSSGTSTGEDETFTTQKLDQTISFSALTVQTYGSADFDPGASASSNLAVSYSSSNPSVATIINNKIHIVASGTSTITASQGGDEEFLEAANVTRTLTVDKAVLTITADNLSKVYNSANPTLTWTPSGFVNNEGAAVLSGSPAVSTTAVTASPVGSYPITIGAGTLAAANYSFTFTGGTLTVDKASQAITFPALVAQTYGIADFDPGASASSNLAVSYASSNPSVATIVNNQIHVVASGTVTITASQNGDDNFLEAASIIQTLTVDKAVLTIAANNLSKPYNSENPTLTWTPSGFVNNEGAAVLSGSPAVSTTAVTASPVGSYSITIAAGTLAAANYSFTFTGGTLSVDKANQTITFPALAAQTYGIADFDPGASASSNLAVSYASSNPSVATIVNNQIHVVASGTVTITASQDGGDNFLEAASVIQTLTVDKAVLTITADNLSKVYNSANPTLTWMPSGFVNNEGAAVLSGSPAVSTTAVTVSPVGSYPITIGAGTLAAANYSFTFTGATLSVGKANQTITFPALAAKTYGSADVDPGATSSSGLAVSYASSDPSVATIVNNQIHIVASGTATITVSQAGNESFQTAASVTRTLTVDKAVLTIAADDLSKPYNSINPTLTWTPSGFVNNEGAGVLSGSPIVSTTAVTASPVGSYPITIAAGTLTAANYSFTFTGGTLTVGKDNQTITFPAIAAKTYGSADVDPGATSSSGLAVSYASSDPSVATIVSNQIHIVASGTATITASQAGNESFQTAASVTRTLTVDKAVLTITADDLSKPYNSVNPTLTWTPSGFVGGEGAAVLSGSPALSTTAMTASPVGSYPITITAGTLTASNYSFTFTGGTLSVGKDNQTITFPAIVPKTYGSVDVDPGATSSSGLTVSYASSDPSVATIVSNKIHIVASGTATITANQAGDEDFLEAANVTRTLTVDKAVLTITADDQSKPYNSVNPTLTWTPSGFVGGEGAAVLSGSPIVSTTAVTASPVGSYPITITAGTLVAANYSFTFTGGTLSVGKANQTITFPAIAAKTYGSADVDPGATASSGLAVSYASSDPSVATIVNNQIHIVASGTATITANQAGNADYLAAPQVTQEITIVTPLTAPTVSGATLTRDATPTWTWSSGGNGGSGTFRYRRNNSNLETQAKVTTATSFTPKTALAQGAQTLYVQERDEAGNWSASGSFSIVIDTIPPDAPQVSGITPTDNSKPTWSWSSSGNGGNGTFRYRRNNSNLKASALVTTTAFTPRTALAQGVQTLYVQERDEAGNWSASGSLSIVIDATLSPPAGPTDVAAIYDFTLSLTWSDVADNEAGYSIYRKLHAEEDYTKIGDVGPDSEGYMDDTVAANATYSYFVAAYNGAGETASAPITVTTRDIHAPDQVVATVANAGRRVNLSWRDNSESEDNTVVWRIKEGESAWTKVVTLDPDTVAYVNTGLRPRLLYTYRVCATDLGGANECSDPVTVNGPTAIKAVSGTTDVDLTWKDNANDEAGFRVYRRTSTEVASTEISGELLPNTIAFTDTTVAEDTTYFYAVEAYTGEGSATTPTEARITTGGVIPPGAFNAVVTPGSTKAKLTWADKSSTETGFAVWRRAQGEPEWTWIKTTGAGTRVTTDTGLGLGILYNYQVCAITSAGGSACSLESGVNGPTELTALPMEGSGVALAWSDNASDETGFIVYRRKRGVTIMTAIAVMDEDGTTYTDALAQAGTTYFYQVCAANSVIDSCSVTKKVVVP